jgi:hypothetical protein
MQVTQPFKRMTMMTKIGIDEAAVEVHRVSQSLSSSIERSMAFDWFDDARRRPNKSEDDSYDKSRLT